MNPKFADVIKALCWLENAKRHDKPAHIKLCRANLSLSYAHTDFVVFRCKSHTDPFYVTFKEANGVVICEFCGQPCDRLLLTGEWQSQEERDQENQTRYEAVSG